MSVYKSDRPDLHRATLETVISRLITLRDENQARMLAYLADGGDDTMYLDGKDQAYQDAIDAVAHLITQTKGDSR